MREILNTTLEVTNINPRREKHGTEKLVLAEDLTFEGVMDAQQLDFLFNLAEHDLPVKQAFLGFWDGGGSPRFDDQQYRPGTKVEIKGCDLRMYEKLVDKPASNEPFLYLTGVTIKDFVLTPNHGHTFIVRFKAQGSNVTKDDLGTSGHQIVCPPRIVVIEQPDLIDHDDDEDDE